MHNIMHTRDLRLRKGCAWPCLEVPAFGDKIVSYIPTCRAQHHTRLGQPLRVRGVNTDEPRTPPRVSGVFEHHLGVIWNLQKHEICLRRSRYYHFSQLCASDAFLSS